WFSSWYGLKRFMYLGCKKNFFVVNVERPDHTWSERIRIRDGDKWKEVLEEEILPTLRELGYNGMAIRSETH
ncbi:MAG: hypothetical protein KIH08_17345, partial [Candidatus Freyarchaeota archaeon]|nr:hypothetical protein [Candidatus Jordarchaeia archaeon]